jgi:hypothetical protein
MSTVYSMLLSLLSRLSENALVHGLVDDLSDLLMTMVEF